MNWGQWFVIGFGIFGMIIFFLILKAAGVKMMFPYTKEWWEEWKKKTR